MSQDVTLLGSRSEAGARWAPGWAAEVRALWTDVCVWSLVQPCLTLCDPMDSVHQAPLSMGFSRQTIGLGCHFPPPGDLPYPGTEPWSFVSPALAGRFLTTHTTWEAPQYDWYPLKRGRRYEDRQEALSCDDRSRDRSFVVANHRMPRMASKPRKTGRGKEDFSFIDL